MTNDQIRNVIIHLDDDDPFLTEIHRRFFGRQKSLSPADRLVYPMGDQAFGIHYVRAYHRAGAWLPNQIWWPSIWRGFCCLTYGSKCKDDDCFEALSLGHPANRAKQVRINALLCTGVSYEEVGNLCGISSNVIEVYAHLFFDFLERRDDETFVLKILNPRSDLAIFNRDKNKPFDSARLLMRIGYCLGPEAVIKVLGLSDGRNGVGQERQPAKNIKETLLSAGEMKAKLSLLAVDDTEFALLKTLIAAEAKQQPGKLDDDWKMGLGALSMSQSAHSVLKGLIMSGSTEQLKSAREYDSQAAAAEAMRKAAEVVAGGGNNAAQNAT